MDKIKECYEQLCAEPSDINEHLPTLYRYATECDSVFETGVRGCVSSWALVYGLLNGDNQNLSKLILLNDTDECDIISLLNAASSENIKIDYIWKNNLLLELTNTYDLTFIDTWHVYGQLKRELDKFSKITNKYIIMHDTTVDEWYGETIRLNMNSEQQSLESGFPKEEINKGVWPAVEEFLQSNANWVLHERYINNNGLTILKKINELKNEPETQLRNPFEIDIPDKEFYTNNELVVIKKKLENKKDNIIEIVKNRFSNNDISFTYSLDASIDRCSKGVCQKLIDVDKNVYPSKILYKIGNGGNKKECIVCCTTNLTDVRAIKGADIHQSLEKVGFNGYFYLFNGGFPTPRGMEMKYAGVPYCFKIFMMLEAEKLGFERIIWIDAACYAVNNPQILFDVLCEDDAIFRQFFPYSPGIPTYENSVFKETIEELNALTNRNFVNSIAVCSVVFGLNLKSDKIQKFVNEYYEMVKLGTPFLSNFPEEVVITSIFNKDEYKHLFYNRHEGQMLFIHENYMCNNFDIAKLNGYYFVQRQN
jgi:hypothetical protein